MRKKTTLQQRALAEAKKLVGVMEQGGNNRGKKVMEIIRANGGTGPEPWCGSYVAYCYRKAGSKVVQRGWAAVRFLGYMTGQRVVKRARGGDIVCFTFDHTGIVVTYCNARGSRRNRRDATHIKTIEGNTGSGGAVSDSSGGDGVHIRIRPLKSVSRFVRVVR